VLRYGRIDDVFAPNILPCTPLDRPCRRSRVRHSPPDMGELGHRSLSISRARPSARAKPFSVASYALATQRHLTSSEGSTRNLALISPS
jgi:hypothetical protein